MEKIKKVCNAITTLIVIVALILAMLLVGVRMFGLQVYTVLSGSMEPVYHTGSVIYVKPADDPAALEEDTVITFYLGGTTVATHRIIEVVETENGIAYRTKGDANDVEDGGLVKPESIIGTPVFTIPKLGYIISFIQTKPGRLFTMALIAFTVLLGIIPDILSEEKDEKKTGKNKKKETTEE